MSGSTPYRIEEVDVAPQERRDEQLGSKPKFWFKKESLWYLFKKGRENEDWSEKVASHLAELLGLPHAQVDLARCDTAPGIISPTFLSSEERLVHGNQLLFELDPGYDVSTRYKARKHTLPAIRDTLESFNVKALTGARLNWPPDFTAGDLFAGYLLLDAWIGNTDRHHENWGIIEGGGERRLAPSFDHASSLGRNEPADRITLRLSGKDPRVTVKSYIRRCRSGLYGIDDPEKPLGTMDAFALSAKYWPVGASFWLGRLRSIPDNEIEGVFQRIPTERITKLNRRFSVEYLRQSREVIDSQRGATSDAK